MKKIVTILCLLLIIFFAWYKARDIYIYFSYQKDKQELPATDYYKYLGLDCYQQGKDTYGCCMSSLKDIAAGNYKVAPPEGCPIGSEPKTLRCLGSLKWCQPEK
ncbi:MAG: hypothetical protein C3F02_01440 [Parcubacteria group bacterium]|nr:MAG: hypothetical protein C3F02_01440 [Parcubacteria group bacterium]